MIPIPIALLFGFLCAVGGCAGGMWLQHWLTWKKRVRMMDAIAAELLRPPRPRDPLDLSQADKSAIDARRAELRIVRNGA
jgi:hypothetical protein